MRFSLSVTFLAFLLPLIAHCKSLWIDRSCTTKAQWNFYWHEQQEFAKRAVHRMGKSSDFDFDRVFKRVFKTERNSEAGQYVKRIMKSMRDLTMESTLERADIRMYCDNDDRWVPRKVGGGWEDNKNQMVASRLSCKTSNGMGVTYVNTVPGVRGQSDTRRVITLCNRAFGPIPGYPSLLEDAGYLHETLIEKTDALVAHTIVHELAHALDLTILDYTYSWKNSIKLDAARTIKNADNYAYIGTWAVLADMDYTLERVERNADKEDRDAVEANIQKGYIEEYEDVTKRSLRVEKFST